MVHPDQFAAAPAEQQLRLVVCVNDAPGVRGHQQRGIVHPLEEAAVFVLGLPERVFGALQFAPAFGLGERAFDRGREPLQVVLEHIIVRAAFHRFNRGFFANRGGNKDEGNLQGFAAQQLQGGHAAKGRQ